MDLTLRSIKTNNWSADIFLKQVTSMSEPPMQSLTLVSIYPFWQLSIDHNRKDVHYQVKHRLYNALDT